MIKVKVHNNNVEAALRELKREARDSSEQLKNKSFYKKPSELRREKINKAKRKIKKKQRNGYEDYDDKSHSD